MSVDEVVSAGCACRCMSEFSEMLVVTEQIDWPRTTRGEVDEDRHLAHTAARLKNLKFVLIIVSKNCLKIVL